MALKIATNPDIFFVTKSWPVVLKISIDYSGPPTFKVLPATASPFVDSMTQCMILEILLSLTHSIPILKDF